MQMIETPRLLLRDWRREDIEDVYEYSKHPQVGPNAGWAPHVNKKQTKEVLRLFAAAQEVWAIYHKADGRVIGSIGLHAAPQIQGMYARELGYALAPQYWNMGYMTEAAQAVIGFAFGPMGLERLSAGHFPENQRSQNVLVKCGFVNEGQMRSARRQYDGTVHDIVIYSLLKQDYQAKIKETGV
ncbi:MAG: GNAT family N-acetyltransferase [Oscillospiraceae bacterium]